MTIGYTPCFSRPCTLARLSSSRQCLSWEKRDGAKGGKGGKEIKIKKSVSCYLSGTSYLILMWKPEEKCTLKTDTLEIPLLWSTCKRFFLKNLCSGGTFTLKYRCPGSGGTLRLKDKYPGGTLTLKYRYPGSGATLTLKYRYPGGDLTMKYRSRRWFTWLTMSCMDCSLMPRESSGIEGFSINTCFWHLSVAGMGSAAHKGKECIQAASMNPCLSSLRGTVGHFLFIWKAIKKLLRNE